jgi:very-short-patch-repair endonuclease/predicted transcriptional regulator of viral defense system
VPEPLSNRPKGPDQKTSVRGPGLRRSEPLSISPDSPDQKTSVRGVNAPRRRDTSSATRYATAARVARVATAQWGVIGITQLRDCGLGKSTVGDWSKAGRLHPRYPGVYTVGHSWLPVEGELTAALLAAGPGAVLSHATAAWWWGLVEQQPQVIEVSVPGRRKAPPPGLRFHHPRHLKHARHRRLPVTPVIDTLVDFAATAPLYQVRRALAEAEFLGLVELDQVWGALGRGRLGSARLREALTRHQPELAMTRNRFEAAFLELCEAAGLPVPEFNTRFCGYVVDAIWREQRVAVELDGLQGHRTPAQLERDHGRDLVLRQNRFETRRYTWSQVTRKSAEVVADLPRAVRALAAA